MMRLASATTSLQAATSSVGDSISTRRRTSSIASDLDIFTGDLAMSLSCHHSTGATPVIRAILKVASSSLP